MPAQPMMSRTPANTETFSSTARRSTPTATVAPPAYAANAVQDRSTWHQLQCPSQECHVPVPGPLTKYVSVGVCAAGCCVQAPVGSTGPCGVLQCSHASAGVHNLQHTPLCCGAAAGMDEYCQYNATTCQSPISMFLSTACLLSLMKNHMQGVPCHASRPPPPTKFWAATNVTVMSLHAGCWVDIPVSHGDRCC